MGQSKPSSKYDVVKVKIWVEPSYEHYFVLSRFLVSRMLTCIQVDNVQAVKIALQTKQFMVDNGLLHVPQPLFLRILFLHMAALDYGANYIRRYRDVNGFFSRRTPIVVLLGGPPCSAKSTLAQALAAVMNMPNVQQSDLLYDLFHWESMQARPSLYGPDSLTTTPQLLNRYYKECRLMSSAISSDITKTLSSGKSVIIEGLHMDPGLYFHEFQVTEELENAVDSASTQSPPGAGVQPDAVCSSAAGNRGCMCTPSRLPCESTAQQPVAIQREPHSSTAATADGPTGPAGAVLQSNPRHANLLVLSGRSTKAGCEVDVMLDRTLLRSSCRSGTESTAKAAEQSSDTSAAATAAPWRAYGELSQHLESEDLLSSLVTALPELSAQAARMSLDERIQHWWREEEGEMYVDDEHDDADDDGGTPRPGVTAALPPPPPSADQPTAAEAAVDPSPKHADRSAAGEAGMPSAPTPKLDRSVAGSSNNGQGNADEQGRARGPARQQTIRPPNLDAHFKRAGACIQELEARLHVSADVLQAISEPQQSPEHSRPIIVPMLVCADDCDAAVLERIAMRDLQAHTALGSAVAADGGERLRKRSPADDGPANVAKFRAVKAVCTTHLRRYREYGVPVYDVRLGELKSVLQKMHSHLLSCIDRHLHV